MNYSPKGIIEVAKLSHPAIAIHGGAGNWDVDEKTRLEIESFLNNLLKDTLDLLVNKDYTALDAVEYAVSKLEDSGLFNAGSGSSLNIEGNAQMDAGIMDGSTMRAGAVALVERVRNPIKLARKVMEKTDHVLIGGYGADLLSRIFNMENRVINIDVIRRYRDLVSKRSLPPYYRKNNDLIKSLGIFLSDTVGAVALDRRGNLAAATSTGGMWLKLVGRIGDSPIPGAGFYADKQIACSATGVGETIMSISLCRTIALHYRYLRDLKKAVLESFGELEYFFGVNTAGAIILSHEGELVMYYNTRGMARGYFSINLSEPHSKII
ncbi:MAG: isoaspartyl peptidase/L-asparaginase [Sulfolobales archaeon]